MAEVRQPRPRLLGRDAEVRQLRDAIRSAAAGRLVGVVVEGEAGIGKSALVAAALDEARAAGTTVRCGAATEIEQDRPFGPLIDALGGPAVPDAAAGSGQGDGVVDVAVVILEEFVAGLERMAIDDPVVLAVEDVHWADASSLGVLRTVLRHLADLPVALVVSLRPSPRSPALDALLADLADRGAARIALGPLAGDAVDALVAEEVGERPGPRLLAAVRRAGGNPLYVLELLASLREEGMVRVEDRRAELTDEVLPPGMRTVLLHRLATLPPGAIEILHVAAVLGPSFTPGELALVMGRPVVSLLADLTEASRSGILGEAEERIVFRHDLLREALYEDLPVATRSAIHLEAFRALERSGAAPSRQVPHLLRAASADDPETIGLLVEKAASVSDSSPSLAISLFERARELLPHDAPAARRATAGMLVPLVLQCRAPEALEHARALLAAPLDAVLRSGVLEGFAFAVLRHPAPSRFAAEIEQVITDELDTRTRRWMEAFLAEVRLGAGEGEAARRLAEGALEWAGSEGDDELAVYALGTLAWAHAGAGDIHAAVALAGEAVARRRRLTTCRYNVDVHLGVAFIEADDLEAARVTFREGRAHDAARGDVAATTYYHFGLLGCGYLAGEWDDACAEGEAGLSLVDEGIGPPGMTVLGRGLLARIALHRDDLGLAESLVAAAERDLLADGAQVGGDVVLWVRALLLDAAGDPAGASTLLGAVWDLLGGMRYFMTWRTVAPDLVRLALAAGDRARAVAVAAEAVEGGRRGRGIRSAEAAALRCRGLLEADPETLAAALDAYRSSPRRIDQHACAEELGAALVAAGRVDDAVAVLREAAEGFDTVGATRDLARVTATLRGVGATRARARRRARVVTGWESLTPTELDVVALVAEGLTNRQIAERLFISRYTVETHLKHVFAKLDLTSRVELAGEVTRRRETT